MDYHLTEAESVFLEHRNSLERLAYRMLGSLSDAEDVIQEAFLKWMKSSRDEIDSKRGYLITLVTRLCIDHKRKMGARKEVYVGPWLPEPTVAPRTNSSLSQPEITESISIAFLVVMESLAPVERAAYLLKRVFNHEYSEIAQILERTESTCRKLVSRAEERVLARRERFDVDPREVASMTETFLAACSSGDMTAMLRLLAPNVVAVSDGGGKATAALVPIQGSDRVARFFIGLARRAKTDFEIRWVDVNGLPGLMAVRDGKVHNVTLLDILDGQITACYVWRNPEKLSRINFC